MHKSKDRPPLPKKEMLALFWDTDISDINIEKHSEYIIRRILEYGDLGSVKWMFKTYRENLIKKVLNESRDISKKSSSYWKLFFGEYKNVDKI